MATASQKITLEELKSCSYLIKFFDLILGILMADPTRDEPVMNIPLKEVNHLLSEYHAAPMIEKVREIATPT